MLATCILFFVISGILFWATDYFTQVIGADKETVTIAFGLTSITAPVLGAVSGGLLAGKIGFSSSKTLPSCMVLAIVSYAVAFFIPIHNDFYAVITHIWFLLFFGGMLLPITNGRLTEIVDKKYLANS